MSNLDIPSRGADTARLGAPIQRRKLSREVLDRLLAHIRSGAWAPGAHLPSERELMQTFAVGRPAIREALQALERMGLISISHGERARVVPLSAQTVLSQVDEVGHQLLSSSPQTLEHLKQARLFFETGMVRIAAERATDADVARLREALQAQREADAADFLARDLAFHGAIAEVSGNPIYVAVSKAMLSWLERFHTSLVRAPGAEKLTLTEHGRIVERIAARDPDGAAAAMTAHLTRASKLYRKFESRAPHEPGAKPHARKVRR